MFLMKGKFRTDWAQEGSGAGRIMPLILWSRRSIICEKSTQSFSCRMLVSRLKTDHLSSNWILWKVWSSPIRIWGSKLILFKSTFHLKLSIKIPTPSTKILISRVPSWRTKVIGSDCPIEDNLAIVGQRWPFLPWFLQFLWYHLTLPQTHQLCFFKLGKHRLQHRQLKLWDNF